ncbi:MAG: addiction module protein [Candidatus Wallbacteria bacterium]|nr:addiction module protein [Candidatus Wallbacteria bacterium]
MTAVMRNILTKALNLKPVQRAELIEELLQSFEKKQNPEIDRLWADEAESRIEAHDTGKIGSDSAKNVFGRINRL